MVNLSLFGADLDRIREKIRKRLKEHPDLKLLIDGDPDEALFTALANGPALDWSTSVIDDPNVGWFNNPDESTRPLTDIALSAQREILIVTPYLIPTDKSLEIGKTLIDRGVKISVLTNSLSSNDMVMAQAAYGQYRKKILDIGVELFELRGDATIAASDDAIRSNLHSKFLIFDDEVVFIGSLNLDPRSLYLNTELGVALHSEELSQEFRANFELMIHPDNAWRLEQTPEGILWHSSAGTLKKQPAKNSWQRFSYYFFSLFPISNQL
jgi:putative cardiolipin synthase